MDFYRILLLNLKVSIVLRAVSLPFLINSIPNFDSVHLAPSITIPSVYYHHSALNKSLPAIFLTCGLGSLLHIRWDKNESPISRRADFALIFLWHQDGSPPSDISTLLYLFLFFYILQVHISLLLPYCRHGHCGVFSGRSGSYWVKLVIQEWSLSSSHTLEEARIEGVGNVTTQCKEGQDVVVVSLWLNLAS